MENFDFTQCWQPMNGAGWFLNPSDVVITWIQIAPVTLFVPFNQQQYFQFNSGLNANQSKADCKVTLDWEKDLLKKYWMWGDEISNLHTSTDLPLNKNLSSKQIRRLNITLKASKIMGEVYPLLYFLSNFQDNSEIIVFGRDKPKSKPGPRSQTRSTFIGVTKNNKKWQALISIEYKKTYIGSYPTQIHAAVAFDFYSILLSKGEACTNFDYNKSQIMRMLKNFVDNGYEFMVKEYLKEGHCYYEHQ